MTSPAQAPVRASTQEHLDIEEIKDDLVILKGGSCCLICQTTAVNFDLLSETEQEATIFAYASLLNSLSFPIQILIRSQQKDVSGYLNLLAQREKKVIGEKLKKQIRHYRDFVEKTVREKEVLDKKFYIVIPFSAFELGAASLVTKGKAGILPYPLEIILAKAKTSLYPKRDHLIRQFNRLGLDLKSLTTPELIKLFYNIYNPEATGFEEFVSSGEYKVPIMAQTQKILERRGTMTTQDTNNPSNLEPVAASVSGQPVSDQNQAGPQTETTPPSAPSQPSQPGENTTSSQSIPVTHEPSVPSSPTPNLEPSNVDAVPTEIPSPETPLTEAAPATDKPEASGFKPSQTEPAPINQNQTVSLSDEATTRAQKEINGALEQVEPEEQDKTPTTS